MEQIVISDASCLILLTKIGAFQLLNELFESIVITPEVQAEYGIPLPSWIRVEEPENNSTSNFLKRILDPGEAASIALSLQKSNCLLIIDERLGRKVAQGFQIEIIGTIGLLLAAKRKGLLNEIRPLIQKVRLIDFRVSLGILNSVLIEAGEAPFIK